MRTKRTCNYSDAGSGRNVEQADASTTAERVSKRHRSQAKANSPRQPEPPKKNMKQASNADVKTVCKREHSSLIRFGESEEDAPAAARQKKDVQTQTPATSSDASSAAVAEAPAAEGTAMFASAASGRGAMTELPVLLPAGTTAAERRRMARFLRAIADAVDYMGE